jgi:hypothetical protein
VTYVGATNVQFNGAPWYLEVFRDPGHNCGECGRRLKVYHRKLSRSMARCLMRLYRLELIHTEHKFFHVKAFDKEGARGEFGVVAKWGLAVERPNDALGKRSSGYWALTEFGRRFVILGETVPEYVILKWGSQLLGFAGPPTNAKQCLESGNRFNYQELMSWTPDQETVESENESGKQ